MAVDIATLGIRVDASEADNANTKLDQLAKTGDKAEKSTKGLANTSKALQAAMSQVVSAINANTTALNNYALGNDKAASSAKGAASAAEEMAIRVARLKASVDPLGTAQDRVNAELAEASALYEAGAIDAERYSQAVATLNARSTDLAQRQSILNARLAGTASGARLSANEALNLSRQFADVGVSAAMGMNPLMILIQQGPQIADIMKTSGLGVKGLATEMVKFVGPAMRFLGPLALIGTTAALAFGAIANEAEKGLGDVRKEFGLTEEQMERLKDKNTDLGVTMGDAWIGFKETVKDVFIEAFGPQIDQVSKWFDGFYQDQVDGVVFMMKDVVGTFVGGYEAIKATWSLLPAAIGDVLNQVANLAINSIAKMINKGIEGINQLNENLPSWMGGGKNYISWRMGENQVDNPYAGAASQASDIGGEAFARGRARGEGFVDRVGGMLRENTLEAREARIRGDAGDPNKSRGGRRAQLSEEEKAYKQAVAGAENYIKALQAETEEIGKNERQIKQLQTAREAAEVTKAAEALGTDEARQRAAELTKQMADEQKRWEDAMQADKLKEFKKALNDQADALAFETSMIGMNNEAREVAMAQREIDLKLKELERQGWEITPDLIQAETDKILANAAARGKMADAVEDAERTATAMRDMATAVREATEGFGELFGTAGEGFANLINTIVEFDARKAESQAELIKLQKEYNEGQIKAGEYEFERGRISQQMANDQIAQYGYMISAAKSFFKEGSTGWKVLQAAEQAYRMFQFAMQIKSMFFDNAETANSVANSGARAAADGVAAVAKAIASLPFPLNLVAGAATLAALVGLGVAITGGFGGGGGKGGSKVAEEQVGYTGGYKTLGSTGGVGSFQVAKPSVGMAPVGGNRQVIELNNFAPGVDIEAERADDDRIVLIAKKVVKEEAPKVIAGDLSNQNSKTSKQIKRSFEVTPRRGG